MRSHIETPAEHIRNALMVLLGSERELGDGVVLFDARDVDAIEDRLYQALEQLTPKRRELAEVSP